MMITWRRSHGNEKGHVIMIVGDRHIWLLWWFLFFNKDKRIRTC